MRRRRLRSVAAALTVCTASACGGAGSPSAASPSTSTTAASTLPCADATEVELGSPYTYASRGPAYFSTSGGTVYLVARRFEQGGFLDVPHPRTLFSVGPGSTPPVVDPQAATVAGVRSEVQAGADEWVPVDLPAGQWWVLSSNGGDVRAASCVPGGVSDPDPVG
ncbi:MAG: hypothetical protein ACR2K2_07105 [Mycobacteriales bacterium]